MFSFRFCLCSFCFSWLTAKKGKPKCHLKNQSHFFLSLRKESIIKQIHCILRGRREGGPQEENGCLFFTEPIFLNQETTRDKRLKNYQSLLMCAFSQILIRSNIICHFSSLETSTYESCHHHHQNHLLITRPEDIIKSCWGPYQL